MSEKLAGMSKKMKAFILYFFEKKITIRQKKIPLAIICVPILIIGIYTILHDFDINGNSGIGPYAAKTNRAPIPVEIHTSNIIGNWILSSNGINGKIEILSIVDSVIINDVKLNRGNAKIRLFPLFSPSSLPVTVKFGEIINIYSYILDTQILEIEIQTDKGTWTVQSDSMKEAIRNKANFIVYTQKSEESSANDVTSITIIPTVDNITIQGVKINRGNTGHSWPYTAESPKTLNFGQRAVIRVEPLPRNKVKEIELKTDKGTFLF